MDCENKCDSLILIHGFPLQSDCKNRAFALLHRYVQRFTDQQGEGFLSTVFPLWILLWKLPGSWLKPSEIWVGVHGQKHCSCIKVELSRVTSRASYPREPSRHSKEQLAPQEKPIATSFFTQTAAKYNIERSQEQKGAECEDSKIRLHMQWQQWVCAVQKTGKLNVRVGTTNKPSKAQRASQQKQHSLTGSSRAQRAVWQVKEIKPQHFNWCNLTGTSVKTAAQHRAAILMGLFCWAEQWSLFLKTVSKEFVWAVL